MNRYDAGAGNDVVDAANQRAELVSCGSGRDRALVDSSDRVRNCERWSTAVRNFALSSGVHADKLPLLRRQRHLANGTGTKATDQSVAPP